MQTKATKPSRYFVGRVEDLPPGSMRLVPIGRFGIGVFNVRGKYHALNNYCPHRGGPLCIGRITGTTVPGDRPYDSVWVRDGEILICPWHGWEFEIETGYSLTTPKLTVRKYPVSIDKGKVLIDEVTGRNATDD